MAKKKFDPKAKAKRQKVILAVGGVILLALLAFQVPRTMKLMKSQSQPSASSTPPTTTSLTPGSTPLAPPTLDGSSGGTAAGSAGATGSSTATSADGITDPSNPLPPNAGQLVSFSKFASKDPFKQQIAAECEADPASGSPAGCASATTTTSSGSKSTPSGTAGTKPAGFTSGGPAAKPTSARIFVNGIESSVSVGASFPTGTPVFTLVSLTRKVAKVGIAGGTYENGAPTVTLTKGRTVTLMNTADGTRYTLRLVAVS